MIIVNFSHLLTEEHCTTIVEMAGQKIQRVIDVAVHFDNLQPFGDQVVGLVEAVDLSSAEWQSNRILIVPPSFSQGAVTLIAYLHGLIGHFLPIVRIRPKEDDLGSSFEVAEIIALDPLRGMGRRARSIPGDGT